MWSKDLPTQMAIPAGVQPHVVSVVLRELQTLSGHPNRRPRDAQQRVDNACAGTRRDRNGEKLCLRSLWADGTSRVSVVLDTMDRNQRQAQRIEPAQQTLQSGLVEDTGQGRDRQAIPFAVD